MIVCHTDAAGIDLNNHLAGVRFGLRVVNNLQRLYPGKHV
jgi:hypothetical protein